MTSLQTHEIIPRNYGTTYSTNGETIFMDPARQAIGGFLVRHEKQKRQLLEEWQEYILHGGGSDTVPEKYRELLNSKPSKFRDALVGAIKNETGTKKLWLRGGPDAVSEISVYGDTLQGKVMSRRDSRRNGILKQWLTAVIPNKDGAGLPYNEARCQCDNTHWDFVKHVEGPDTHSFALVYTALNLEISAPPLPFTFDSLTETGVVVEYYLMGIPFYGLNKALLDNPEVYEPSYLGAIEKGMVRFEPLPQKRRERRVDLGYVKAQGYVEKEVRRRLAAAGFGKTGIGAVEFKGTPFETLCENYERGDIVMRLVFNERLPPLLVCRRLGEEQNIFYEPDNAPLQWLYREGVSVDDRTRRVSTVQLVIPSHVMPELKSMNVLGNFKKDYRELIAKYRPDDKNALYRQLGL